MDEFPMEQVIEVESSDDGINKVPCETTELPVKLDVSKNDEEVELPVLKKTRIDEDNAPINSEITHDSLSVVDMNIDDEVSVLKIDDVPPKVESNPIITITIDDDDDDDDEITAKSEKEINEIKVSKQIDSKQETDFVSEDAKENADNFDGKWDYFRSLSKNAKTYDYVKKRWGNSALPDPSVDLTYRKRQSRERLKVNCDNSKKRKRERTVSCTSHMDKLMDDIRSEYHKQLQQLCERHILIMGELHRHHQTESIQFAQQSMQFNYINEETANMMFYKQNEDKMKAADQYRRCVLDLITKTQSVLGRYEKYSEEIIVFHKQYEIGGSGMLKNEQLVHLEETERMYRKYDTFYS